MSSLKPDYEECDLQAVEEAGFKSRNPMLSLTPPKEQMHQGLYFRWASHASSLQLRGPHRATLAHWLETTCIEVAARAVTDAMETFYGKRAPLTQPQSPKKEEPQCRPTGLGHIQFPLALLRLAGARGWWGGDTGQV